MLQFRFVIGLFIGFQFNIMHIVLNAPINAENDLEPDFNAAEARSLFDEPDQSMNGADAYGENELKNIFINPEEMGPYFEDDIIISDDLILNDPKPPKLWPNGVIPIEVAMYFTKKQKKRIMSALHELTSKTCLQFPLRTIEKDYVNFVDNKAGCSSKVGHHGGQQFINLNRSRCFSKFGTAEHEILHTVGFHHEQSRNDRDDYVKILWENIQKDHISNYNKRPEKIDPSVDFTYDYGSVMHYSRYEFAIDKTKEVMIPLFNTTNAPKMGQRFGMSPLDIKKINAKYHCATKGQDSITETAQDSLEEATQDPFTEKAQDSLEEATQDPFTEKPQDSLEETTQDLFTEKAQDSLEETTQDPFTEKAQDSLEETTQDPFTEKAQDLLEETTQDPFTEKAQDQFTGTTKSHTNIKKIDGIALQFKTKDRMLDLLFNPKYMYHKSN